MGIPGKSVKKKCLWNVPDVFCSNTVKKEMKAMNTAIAYNLEYNFIVFGITKRMQNR